MKTTEFFCEFVSVYFDYLPSDVALEVAPLVRFHVTVVSESPLNTALSVTVLPLSPATLEGAVTRPENNCWLQGCS